MLLEHRVSLHDLFQSQTLWFYSVLESVPQALREQSRLTHDSDPMRVLKNTVKVTDPRSYKYDQDAFQISFAADDNFVVGKIIVK